MKMKNLNYLSKKLIKLSTELELGEIYLSTLN